MRVLLLGAGGMLGRDLAAAAPDDVRLVVPPRVDVTERDAVARVLDEARAAWVVNATGYTAVDRAEEEPERAHAVNAAAVGALGALCAERRVGVLHFGSDYVFDGSAQHPYREDDATAPLGAYGRSKLAGERALLASGATALVVRAQWLFGTHGRSFPRTMWERARAGRATRVVDDQRGRPTYTVDLARAAWRLLLGGHAGVVHVANDGEATWFEVAAAVFAAAGAPDLVAPCSTAQYPTAARRPAYSVLDSTRYESLAGASLPDWRDALSRFLSSLAAESSPGTSATAAK